MEVIQRSRVVQRHAERIEEQVCVWIDRSRTRLMQREAGCPKERPEQSRHACSSALVEPSLPDHSRRLLVRTCVHGCMYMYMRACVCARAHMHAFVRCALE